MEEETPGGDGMVLETIRGLYDEMFNAEKRVAAYILEHPRDVLKMNISALAKASDTSDATIIRTCKHLGYSGYYQFKIILAGESGPAEGPPSAVDPKDIGGLVSYIGSLMAGSVKNISMDTVNGCVDLLAGADMVYITGWGNTGAVASDFAHRLGRCGKRTIISAASDFFINALYLGGPADVLVVVSHSGASLHIIQAIEVAGQRGMKCILITNSADSRAGTMTDYVLNAGADCSLFRYYGGESHLFEMLLVDIMLFFFNARYPELRTRTDGAEILLSQYKL
jgi:DNA-binding MurR/RpiR family transcriptional regulator